MTTDRLDEITAKGYADPVDAEWLVGEVVRLRALLAEAAVMVADWGAYADPYFIEKWGLDDDLAKLRAAAAGTGPTTSPTPYVRRGDGRPGPHEHPPPWDALKSKPVAGSTTESNNDD